MESSFDKSPDDDLSEQAAVFLRSVSPLVKKIGGSANILVFQSRMRVVYAATNRSAKRSRRSPTPVPNTSGPALPLAGEAVPLETADGGDYLVCFYGVPSGSMLVKYLITYCPISEIGGWVRDASVLVLVISSLFALLALAALWITARGITRPLQRLCRESERIGGGGFEEIAQSFPLLELEELRLAMKRRLPAMKKKRISYLLAACMTICLFFSVALTACASYEKSALIEKEQPELTEETKQLISLYQKARQKKII